MRSMPMATYNTAELLGLGPRRCPEWRQLVTGDRRHSAQLVVLANGGPRRTSAIEGYRHDCIPTSMSQLQRGSHKSQPLPGEQVCDHVAHVPVPVPSFPSFDDSHGEGKPRHKMPGVYFGEGGERRKDVAQPRRLEGRCWQSSAVRCRCRCRSAKGAKSATLKVV